MRWCFIGCTVLTLCASSWSHASSEKEFIGVLRDLVGHVEGKKPLEEEALLHRRDVLIDDMEQIGSSPQVIREAFALVDAYEEKVGPLFVNDATRKGLPRKESDGLALHYVVFAVQQGLLDHAYTPEITRDQFKLFNGRAFKTADYFPGAVDEAPDASTIHSIQINATQAAFWGSPVMNAEDPARHPTGCYLAPGSVARVTVPASMVGKGFAVRVGAHSWDLQKKPVMKRLDRVSLVYPIENKETLVANPLGGGIYIEVPYLADAGLVEVKIQNAVRSPFYSARSFDQTSNAEWEMERLQPGPWADFESDKFMMQVPSSWIRTFDNPRNLMREWDIALDSVSMLFGRPLLRNKSVLYLQVDVVIRGNAYYPGYPQSNTPYDPRKNVEGVRNHWLLKGPRFGYGAETTFHEIGHAQLFTKFRGEVEAVVNLPYVAVLNKGFGEDLDTAFGKSFHNEHISLNQAAIMWMVTENFRAGKPMDISNSTKNEVRYQHRGYGKYVEIVNLFGWAALEEFWRSVQLDYLDGVTYQRNADPVDNRILRMSRSAGADLTPLIHFWGIHPEDPAALKTALEKEGLKPSALIYDRLNHYATEIPMSREAFVAHGKVIYPMGIKEGRSPDFGVGWYHVWSSKYDASHGEAAQEALRKIIDTYFPAGRPSR